MPSSESKGWATVAFGDLVMLSKERAKDPLAAGLDRYVGLDHLEPGELKVKRWGNVTDGTTFTNVFRPGQVLFGKRRAYQRKLAVADFSGVCSGDIYIFTPKDDRLLPELLPFICQTDGFFNHAIGTSAGSLSPRTNWKSLASYDFALPPLDEQLRLLGALQSVESAIQALKTAIVCADGVLSSTIDTRISTVDAPLKELGAVASVERGKFSHRPRNLPEFFGGDAEFVQTGDVAASRGRLGPSSQRLSEIGKQYSKSFPAGTVLVTIAAVIGATAVATREVWCPDSVVGISPNPGSINPFFLEFALRRLRPLLENQHATESTQKNINLATLRPLLIPVPAQSEQESIVAELQMVEHAIVNLDQRQKRLRTLRDSIIEEVAAHQ